MNLVYLSPVPWDSFSQRPHKFVEWFRDRTGGLVLWVDPYPTRLPSWKDFLRARPYDASGQSKGQPSWLATIKPGGIPIEPLPGSGWINGLVWRPYLRQIEGFKKKTQTLLVCGKPSDLARKVIALSPDCQTVYDAMDDFPAFYSGLSRYAMVRRQLQIAQKVDIILASSSNLKSCWSSLHKDVRLVHNGLDLATLQSVKPIAKSSERTVFGYVGTIGSWFDWTWLFKLAETRPNDEIRLIGPVFEQPIGKVPSNIKLLPPCDHAAALNTMAQFHVGLIPFKLNALTASVDPIKYYEYRAVGLPVISTDFGEMSLRIGEQGVFISQSMSDVPALAESAVKFSSDKSDASAFAVQNTWGAHFDAAKIL